MATSTREVSHSMSGHKNIRELRKGVSAERRAKTHARALATLAEMPLQELRQARNLSQQNIAELLELTQPEVSKMERRADVYVSTLRRYIEAMGGELEIRANFPDGSVNIDQFHALDPA